MEVKLVGKRARGRPSPYDAEFRASVVEFAEAHGVKPAATEFKLTEHQVSRWLRIHRRKSGGPALSATQAKRTVGLLMRSNRFTGLPRHAQKELLAKEFMSQAAMLLDRMRSPDKKKVVTPRGDIVEVEQPHLEARDVKDITLAIAVFVDKSVLLSGEATSRHEHVDVTELEKALNAAIADPKKRRELALRVIGGTPTALPAKSENSAVPKHAKVVVPRAARRKAS